MLAFLLSFLHLVHTNSLSNKKNLILLPKKISTLIPQWYYVHYSSSKDINTIKFILPNVKIDSTNFKGDTIILFLTPKEVQAIYSLANIKIYIKPIPKNPLSKISSISSKNETYIIYAHSSFNPSKYTQKVSNSGPYYFVSTNQPEILESDPSVLSYSKVPKFSIQNRWTTGFIQSGDENEVLRNNYYSSNRLYNDRGLNGSDVIVTLIDSGLDLDNCLFKDPNYDTPFSTTNYKHRKVVRYDPFADEVDKLVGHGTHCGGTIAGQIDTFPINLYNGLAPAAKLYVADVVIDEQSNMLIDISFVPEIIEQAKKLKSPILSCSWGFDGDNLETTAMYDYLGYINKDMLFVFAAGNYDNYYSISSPGDSRNVLTVGASLYPKSGCIEIIDYGPIRISSNGEILNLTAKNRFEQSRINPISYLYDLDVVELDENLDFENYSVYKDKVVILPNKVDYYFDDQLGFLDENGARAVIHYENFESYFQYAMMIINASLIDNSFFNKHKKINITLLNDNCPSGNPEVASFSSKGPTALGRRKPDVMAPGSMIWSASTLVKNVECEFYKVLKTMSGTSMATPAVSGALTLVYQYLKESIHRLPIDSNKPITSALLRAFAVASASGVGENIESGFGNVNLSKILIYPNIDIGRGLRFRSEQIKDNEAHSYIIRTDKIGTFSVSIAWIDLPMSPDSHLPLFSYLEFFVTDPNGVVYDTNEQFSTTKRIIIEDAPVGEYEIRVHMRQIANSDEMIDYSIVIVGPFDHLNFDKNSGELQRKVPNACLSKCPISKGHAKCETANCICDTNHTGSNCEFELEIFTDQKKLNRSLQSREFWYTRIDYSNYKKNFEINKYDNVCFLITANCFLPANESFGVIRFFMNTDNELPLSIPRYSIEELEVQKDHEGNNVTFSFEFPLNNINESGEFYLTAFNDITTNVSLSLELRLRGNIIPDGSSSEKNIEDKKLLFIIFSALFGVTVVSIITSIILGVILCRKKCGHSKNDQLTTSLISNY